jgi:hypothetical protein
MNIDEKTYESWIEYMERFEPMSPILYFIHRERLSEKDQQSGNSGKLICDSPNTPTKGSESSRND